MTQTSNALGWSNILAERWFHPAGELPSLAPRETEIAVLLRGRTVVDRVGSGMRQHARATRGGIWLCPEGIVEEFVSIVEPIDDCLHLFLPSRPFAESLLREFDLDPGRVELRYETIKHDPFIEFIAHQLLREMSEETAGGRLLAETLALALSAHLIRRYSATSLHLRLARCSTRPLDAKRLSRVTTFIEGALDRDLTVMDLASVACMSAAHFTRSFRAATGRSPHAYVADRRIELAKERLAKADHSIGDIALAAGFSSHANFTRAFRNATGLTPAAFRADHGEG